MSKKKPLYFWGSSVPDADELSRDSWGVEHIYVSGDLDRCQQLKKQNKGSKIWRVRFEEVA